MAVTVTIPVNAGEFTKVTPGVIRQVRELLRRRTGEVIREVALKQPGEKFIVRVDNRWDKPIAAAETKIQAFWALPGNGRILGPSGHLSSRRLISTQNAEPVTCLAAGGCTTRIHKCASVVGRELQLVTRSQRTYHRVLVIHLSTQLSMVR